MQENIQEKSPIKQKILLYLAKMGISAYEFYKNSGVTRGILQQNNGISEENISRFLAYAPDVNIEWLLTGRGSMLKNEQDTSSNGSILENSLTEDNTIENSVSEPQCDEVNSSYSKQLQPDASHPTALPADAPAPDASSQPRHSPSHTAATNAKAIPLADIPAEKTSTPIPLVTQTAMAGFGGGSFTITDDDIREYYVIPKFRLSRIDFLIEVAGDSMQPHFAPGDLVACTILRDRRFLQWNKPHLLATREQGIIIKRIMPGTSPDTLTAISDNQSYPPFEIPLAEIIGMALIAGSVSLE